MVYIQKNLRKQLPYNHTAEQEDESFIFDHCVLNLHILEHSLLEGLESTYKLLNDIVSPLNGVILIHHDVVCQLISLPQRVS